MQTSAGQPSQPSVGETLLRKIDALHQALAEIRSRQKNLLARLHGERPEKESGPISNALGGRGLLGELDTRIEVIAAVLKEISDNQSTLDRLA